MDLSFVNAVRYFIFCANKKDISLKLATQSFQYRKSSAQMSPCHLRMHRYIAGHNPYDMFNLTIDYSWNFTTSLLLT